MGSSGPYLLFQLHHCKLVGGVVAAGVVWGGSWVEWARGGAGAVCGWLVGETSAAVVHAKSLPLCLLEVPGLSDYPSIIKQIHLQYIYNLSVALFRKMDDRRAVMK